MKYYIAVNSKPIGPFDITQLAQQNITPNTMLWAEGMEKWTKACEIPEVNNMLFAFTQVHTIHQKPKTWLVESILCTVFCCQIFGIIGLIMAILAENSYSRGNYIDAANKSRLARNWTLAGLISSIVIAVVYLGIILISGLFCTTESFYNSI